jgi:hypothetical protein
MQITPVLNVFNLLLPTSGWLLLLNYTSIMWDYEKYLTNITVVVNVLHQISFA